MGGKTCVGQVLYSPPDFSQQVIMNDTNKFFLPVPFENYEKDSFTSSYNYAAGNFTYAISKKCANPQKAMELINFAWSYEGASMFANGVHVETVCLLKKKAQ